MLQRCPALFRTVAVTLLGLSLLLLAGGAGTVAQAGAPVYPAATPAHSIYLPLVYRDYDPSWQWQASSPALVLAPLVATNTYPVAAVDRQGQVHLLWAIDASRPENKYIYHSALTATGWTTPTAILPTLGTSYSPATPVVGPDGALHLLWLNKLTSGDTPHLFYSAYRDGVWTPEEKVFDYPTQSSFQRGELHLDRAGQIHAIVQYVSFYLYTHQAQRTTGTWQATQVPGPSGGLDTVDWTLGDRDGGIRQFFTRLQSSQDRGLYQRWLGGAFLVRDAALPFIPKKVAVQLDALDNLHVYWRSEVPIAGGQVMGLYHQCFDPAMVPAGEPELLTGQEATAATLRPAADEAGRWTLAWQMAATGEAKIGVWQGCRQEKVVSVPPDPESPWPPYQALLSHEPDRWCGVRKTATNAYRVRCSEIATP